MLIPRRTVRTTQPQHPVGINWSNPITQGLGFAHTNTQTGALLHTAGSVSIKPAPTKATSCGIGAYVSSPGGTNNPILQTGQTGITGSGYSLFAFGTADAAPGYAAIDDDNDIIYPRCFQFRLYLGKVELITFDTSGNPYFASATSALSATDLAAGVKMAAVVNGNSIASFQNKVKASGSASGTQRTPTGDFYVGQHKGAGASGWSNALLFSAGWSRALSDAEIHSLSDNPWQIFEDEEEYRFITSAGGTSTVSSDASAVYNVLGSLQYSATASYDIRSAIQSDSAASYSVRESLQQSIVSDYVIRTSTQQNAASTYTIRGLVAQDVAPTYSIRGSVSSDTTAAYNILSATSVSASASAGYNIRGNVNQDVAAIYALRGSVTQDTSATYSILSASAVSSSVTAGYAIKGSVQSSIVAGYSIAQAVQAEIAASYIIRAGAVSEAQAAYVIRGLVQQSIAASYAIDGGTFTGSISDADITRIVQAVLLQLNNESIAAAVWAHATRVITGPTPNDNADALLARAWP